MLPLKRKVRSAGRTSGSIEITLPPEMQVLEGIECRLLLRDGARPEIVIQPDISIAKIVFMDLWERLRIALHAIGDIGPFTMSDFTVSFLPPRYWQERPPLSYQDALAIYRAHQGRFQVDAIGLSQVATFLSVGAAYHLGLHGRYALLFGMIMGYLVSGKFSAHSVDFEQETILHWLSDPAGPAPLMLDPIFETGEWEQTQTGIKRICDQLRAWQDDPATNGIDHRQWSLI